MSQSESESRSSSSSRSSHRNSYSSRSYHSDEKTEKPVKKKNKNVQQNKGTVELCNMFHISFFVKVQSI